MGRTTEKPAEQIKKNENKSTLGGKIWLNIVITNCYFEFGFDGKYNEKLFRKHQTHTINTSEWKEARR